MLKPVWAEICKVPWKIDGKFCFLEKMGSKYKIWLKKLMQFWPRPRESWPWPQEVRVGLGLMLSALVSSTSGLVNIPGSLCRLKHRSASGMLLCYGIVLVQTIKLDLPSVWPLDWEFPSWSPLLSSSVYWCAGKVRTLLIDVRSADGIVLVQVVKLESPSVWPLDWEFPSWSPL